MCVRSLRQDEGGAEEQYWNECDEGNWTSLNWIGEGEIKESGIEKISTFGLHQSSLQRLSGLWVLDRGLLS